MTTASIQPASSQDPRKDRWTALEVFTAIAPHRVGRIRDLDTAFQAETRRAHVVAMTEGLPWDPDGRYPLDVWMKVFQ